MSKNGCTIVTFVLQNFGGSGAHIIESALDVQLTIGGSPTLPILTALHQDIIPGAGESVRLNFTATSQRTDRDMISNEERDTDYHFLGRIAFNDDLGERREMAFCRRFNIHSQRFGMGAKTNIDINAIRAPACRSHGFVASIPISMEHTRHDERPGLRT